MKVTIFGASGYIGSELVKSLLTKLPSTAKIACISRSGKLASNSSQVTAAKGDLTDGEHVRALCQDSNLIVNLVGIMEQELPQYSFEAVHTKGPALLADIVKERKSKGQDSILVHVSALGVDASSSIPYPRSKALGEEAIKSSLGGFSSLSAVIIRPGLVISPHDKFLNRFALLTRWFPVFPVFGPGTSLFQPIMLEDLVQTISNACQLKPADYKSSVVTIEVGGPTVKQFQEIVYMTSRKSRISEAVRAFVPPYFIHLPVSLSLMMGYLFEMVVPKGNLLRLTRDQIRLLQVDNIVSGNQNLSSGDEVETISVLDAVSEMEADALKQKVKTSLTNLEEVYSGGKWHEKQH